MVSQATGCSDNNYFEEIYEVVFLVLIFLLHIKKIPFLSLGEKLKIAESWTLNMLL